MTQLDSVLNVCYKLSKPDQKNNSSHLENRDQATQSLSKMPFISMSCLKLHGHKQSVEFQKEKDLVEDIYTGSFIHLKEISVFVLKGISIKLINKAWQTQVTMYFANGINMQEPRPCINVRKND